MPQYQCSLLQFPPPSVLESVCSARSFSVYASFHRSVPFSFVENCSQGRFHSISSKISYSYYQTIIKSKQTSHFQLINYKPLFIEIPNKGKDTVKVQTLEKNSRKMNVMSDKNLPAKPCKITSKKSRKVMSISTDEDSFGVIVLKESKNEPNEYFRIIEKNDFFLIQSAFTNNYLSIYQQSNKVGAGVISMQLFGVRSEEFKLKSTGNKREYYIFSFSSFALDCEGQDDNEGTRIIQWHYSGKDHQKWILDFD